MINFTKFSIVYYFPLFVCLLCLTKSCKTNNQQSSVLSQQKIILSDIYDSNAVLNYDYYGDLIVLNGSKSDSIIKRVTQVIDGRVHGKQVIFYPNGALRNISFVNSNGKKVADETNFNVHSEMIEHLFWDDSGNLLFRMKFKDEFLWGYEGKPWFIFGQSDINLGDTAVYYIATPIVPNYTTYVEFGLDDDSASVVHYINDFRQFNYKMPMKHVGVKKFKLRVVIKNKNNVEVLIDSTYFSTRVL